MRLILLVRNMIDGEIDTFDRASNGLYLERLSIEETLQTAQVQNRQLLTKVGVR
jgi:hypothetical protein